jgi:sec-independent protein translocase protein TatB
VFGISFTELALILVVTLVAVGPHKLPGMLRTMGEWVRKLRRLTTEVRAQTGIDDILRQEGIDGGLNELRSMLRGDLSSVARDHRPAALPAADPYREVIEFDASREYPPEGVDAHGALPDDLVDESAPDQPAQAVPASPPSASSEAAGPKPSETAGPKPSETAGPKPSEAAGPKPSEAAGAKPSAVKRPAPTGSSVR